MHAGAALCSSPLPLPLRGSMFTQRPSQKTIVHHQTMRSETHAQPHTSSQTTRGRPHGRRTDRRRTPLIGTKRDLATYATEISSFPSRFCIFPLLPTWRSLVYRGRLKISFLHEDHGFESRRWHECFCKRRWHECFFACKALMIAFCGTTCAVHPSITQPRAQHALTHPLAQRAVLGSVIHGPPARPHCLARR